MKPKIMVIDDDSFFRMLLKDFLQQHGYIVTIASSWVDFSETYYSTDTAPDLILFDVNLGNTLSGDKLLSTFKKGRQTLSSAGKTKLVLISSLSEEELAKKSKECGADGYLQKSSLRVDMGDLFLAKLRPFLATISKTEEEKKN